MLAPADAPVPELASTTGGHFAATPRVRLWVGGGVLALSLVTLGTMVVDVMPAHHFVAVPVAVLVTCGAWVAELAVPRWPRLAFVAAAALPHVWLTAIGHVSANYLLLLLMVAWVGYVGKRWELLAALLLSLSALAVGLWYELATFGLTMASTWVSWSVALGAMGLLGGLLGRQERLLVELRRLREEAERRAREAATLLSVSRSVASTLEQEPLMGLLLDELKTVLEYSAASVRLVFGEELVMLAYRGPNPNSWRRAKMALAFNPLNEAVVRGARTVLVPDTHTSDTPLARAYREKIEWRDPAHAHGRSWLGVPLLVRGEAIGLVVLNHATPGYYSERHAALAAAFASHAAVAIQNARLYARAQQTASLEERQRLARELHDSVSQALYGIALGARTARMLLDREDGSTERAKEPVEYVLQLAEAGIAEMRALIFELRPESLEQEGLVAALEKHAASLRARYGLDVAAVLGEEPELALPMKEALYRVAQEALHNTVKHAQAKRIRLGLAVGDDGVTLEVADDGVGFAAGGEFPGHLGLKSMRERMERVGGSLEVRSALGSGTEIRARVPAVAPVPARGGVAEGAEIS